MTDQERIEKLEKQVKMLETINYIRLGLLILSLAGITIIATKK